MLKSQMDLIDAIISSLKGEREKWTFDRYHARYWRGGLKEGCFIRVDNLEDERDLCIVGDFPSIGGRGQGPIFWVEGSWQYRVKTAVAEAAIQKTLALMPAGAHSQPDSSQEAA